MSIVKGTAKWVFIQTPNTRFDPRWTINLYVEQDVAEQLEGEGLTVKEDDTGLYCIFKRNCVTRKGKEQARPAMLDSNNQPYSGEIGNGSVVNVQYRVFTYGDKDEKVSSDLIGIQILELNEFKDKIEFSEDSGGTFDAGAVIDEAFDSDTPFND